MAKRFLIVVDMQKDFIDGSLGTPEAREIAEAAAAFIHERKAAGCTVIATMDTHGTDYPETSEGRKLPVRHCIRGTEGWQLDPRIEKELEGCLRVEKNTFGSVRLPAILSMLAGTEPLSIELIGLCTDICVISNALLLKAHFPEAEISVHPALCAGVTPEKHAAALEAMKSCQIDLI